MLEFVNPGMVRKIFRPYLSFYSPGFHPWELDDRALIAAIERNLLVCALEAERAELLDMRNTGTINDETMRAIAAEIDDAEASLGPALTRARASASFTA